MADLHPVYLLLGPESGNKSARIREIRALCREKNGGEDPEIHRFYPFETEKSEILEALVGQSLFNSHSLVVLAEAENLKAAPAADIAAYLAHPNPDATLIITSSETRVAAAISKAVPKGQTEMFWELFEGQKRQWVMDFFRSRRLTITIEAVELLLSLIDNNTQELKIACTQMAQFFQAELPDEQARQDLEIDEDEVEKFIYHSREESVFTLFEQIANGNLERALDILRTLRLNRDTEMIQLFGGLLWQLRRLYSFKALIEDGDTESQAYFSTTVLGKPAPIKGKKNQQIYSNAAKHYSVPDIERSIITLGETDRLSREMGSSFEQLLGERLIYSIICRGGRSSNAAEQGLSSALL